MKYNRGEKEQKERPSKELEDLALKISEAIKFSNEKKDLTYKKSHRVQLKSLVEDLLKIPLLFDNYYDSELYYIEDSTLHLWIPSDTISGQVADVTAEYLLEYLKKDYIEASASPKKGGGIQIVDKDEIRKVDHEVERRSDTRK